MNTIILAAGAPGVELPTSLVQLYVSCTAPDLQVELEALGPDGALLEPPGWSFHRPRWVLDPRTLELPSVQVRASVRHGETFPSRVELQVSVVSQQRQYLLKYSDGELAGRSRKDVLVLDLEEAAVRMRRASTTTQVHPTGGEAGSPSRTVNVLVDGSASLKAPAARPAVERALSTVVELLGRGDAGGGDRSLVVRWAVVRDGEAAALRGPAPTQAWRDQPASIGSAFEAALLHPDEDHLIVTDDVPDGIDRWSIPEGARVQVLVVGPGVAAPGVTNDQVRVIADAGREATHSLLAEVARSLGWDE